MTKLTDPTYRENTRNRLNQQLLNRWTNPKPQHPDTHIHSLTGHQNYYPALKHTKPIWGHTLNGQLHNIADIIQLSTKFTQAQFQLRHHTTGQPPTLTWELGNRQARQHLHKQATPQEHRKRKQLENTHTKHGNIYTLTGPSPLPTTFGLPETIQLTYLYHNNPTISLTPRNPYEPLTPEIAKQPPTIVAFLTHHLLTSWSNYYQPPPPTGNDTHLTHETLALQILHNLPHHPHLTPPILHQLTTEQIIWAAGLSVPFAALLATQWGAHPKLFHQTCQTISHQYINGHITLPTTQELIAITTP